MKKASPNAPCPCGSNNKYKKCCLVYHKGAKPKTALLLMKSRYAAYAVGDSSYIIKTTHETNAQYMTDTKEWKESIDAFSKETAFLGLEILDFSEDKEEAFVTFKALLSSGEMIEKSHFLKVDGFWLYENGEVS
ncbi:MAG: Unknown protein [uncultured Sulfurovum sp.]|uniref:YchJ-like middle NTF2-like domain-containing protein n=1 Tax=uncultured Sulfurovum sp. TaxID=269237 RepID=A0A6S6T6X2_9BACT|nr:MAG: Unknown protein [uncultured Sulfurovum sp.]